MNQGDPLLAHALATADAMLGQFWRAAAAMQWPVVPAAVSVRATVAAPREPASVMPDLAVMRRYGPLAEAPSHPHPNPLPQARETEKRSPRWFPSPVLAGEGGAEHRVRAVPVPLPVIAKAPPPAVPTTERLPEAAVLPAVAPASRPIAAPPPDPPAPRAAAPAVALAPPIPAVKPPPGPPPPRPPQAMPQPDDPPSSPSLADEQRLGRWLAEHLADETRRPARGGTGFDPRLTPGWPGTLQGPWGWGG